MLRALFDKISFVIIKHISFPRFSPPLKNSQMRYMIVPYIIRISINKPCSQSSLKITNFSL